MFTFSIAPNQAQPGTQMVNIWLDERFMGAICTTKRGVKVVSPHIAQNPEGAIEIERKRGSFLPAILINFPEV